MAPMTQVVREYPACPLVGVGAAVFRGPDVLLVRRAVAPRKGEWSLPGGLQELGETVAEAACREVLEETGVRARIHGVLDVVDLIDRDAGSERVRRHYTLVDVLGTWISGDPTPASDAAEATWSPVDGISNLGLWSETERIILLGFARARHLPPR